MNELTGAKQTTNVNVPPSGFVKRTLIASLHANKTKGLKKEIEDSNGRAIYKVAGLISERG